MIRIMTDVLSFFLERFLNRGRRDLTLQEALTILKAGARRMMRDVGLGFVGIALATAGFLVAYFDVLRQIDLNRGAIFGAVATGGIVLVLVGGVLVFAAWRDKKKGDTFARAVAEEEERHRSPLEQALSAWVLDIVKEREFNRELRRTHAAGNGEDRSSPFSDSTSERKWESAWP